MPKPLAAGTASKAIRLPFAVAYDGPLDLSGRTRLELRHPGAHLSGHFRLPAVVDWLDRLQHGNPLPPMNAALSAPRLEVAGAVLHGVELSVSDEGAAQ